MSDDAYQPRSAATRAKIPGRRWPAQTVSAPGSGHSEAGEETAPGQTKDGCSEPGGCPHWERAGAAEADSFSSRQALPREAGKMIFRSVLRQLAAAVAAVFVCAGMVSPVLAQVGGD